MERSPGRKYSASSAQRGGRLAKGLQTAVEIAAPTPFTKLSALGKLGKLLKRGGKKGDEAATGAANFSRELTAADLGVECTVQELRGTFALKDDVATVRVDMIRGEVQNPLQIVGNMAKAAKASGATTLRIEGTIANERLYHVLQKRYGLTSSGATDSITIPVE